MGARTTRVGTSTSSIHQDSLRFEPIRGEWYPGRVDAPLGRRYHLAPPDGAVPPPAVFVQGGMVKEVILTPEGFEKLKVEIHYLSNDRRREVAERIRVAREFGDI